MNVHSLHGGDACQAERQAFALAPPVEDLDVVGERSLRILVVHDHDVVRSGFRLMLGRLRWVERCLGASNAEDAHLLWNRYDPHVALVDLSVSGAWGADLCRSLRRERPNGRVLLMSAHQRIAPAAARAAGAAGFVSTGSRADEIAQAILQAWDGRTVATLAPAESAGSLSERQREVLRLMASGATNREIASELCLSPHTVKGHTSDLYRRLRVRNRAQAVRRAEMVGLIA
jgi:DNA-binding NarL/FixJ family response regulator